MQAHQATLNRVGRGGLGEEAAHEHAEDAALLLGAAGHTRREAAVARTEIVSGRACWGEGGGCACMLPCAPACLYAHGGAMSVSSRTPSLLRLVMVRPVHSWECD